ncbi:MAG: hypothetical protein KZQ95_01685 [Candidatus Thiodiazotropha sp. (ex Epidulcina cf. delphinae)]|nr:hypothetical protein [Candidatus Thiodiazotropha sp. (ex Epidulcina cf. delphinae)]MCU7928216.1 hypothetical protein [Candidatus Thiodiazotropha sp. (ex Dulcina madagascariensis)]
MTATTFINIALLIVVSRMITIHNHAITLHTCHLMHPSFLFGGCGKTGYRSLQWRQSKQ